jgi:hypothetical protein
MKTVLQECAHFLKCSIKQLSDKINHPENREKLIKHLNGRIVQTTYKDRKGEKKVIVIGGITYNGADEVLAYGKLPPQFNVTVSQHFYSRHRIRLHYPYIPCIIQKIGTHNHYYPMELLEFEEEGKKEDDQCKYGEIFESMLSDINNYDLDDIVWEEDQSTQTTNAANDIVFEDVESTQTNDSEDYQKPRICFAFPCYHIHSEKCLSSFCPHIHTQECIAYKCPHFH